MISILLVEDDNTFALMLKVFLEKNGYNADIKNSVKSSLSALRQKTYGLMLLDYRLDDGTGLDVLRTAREAGLEMPALIMTSFSDIRTAVQSIRQGAFDYIIKPINPDELLIAMNEAFGNKDVNKASGQQRLPDFIPGRGDASKKLQEYIELLAPTDLSVIILGESGTGKENVARSIHTYSKRAKYPFIAVDCGTLSKELGASELFGHVKGAFTGAVQDRKGQFEKANGGTLFLDEVGNLSYDVQVKLLRVLQERVIQPVGSKHPIKVDLRIIAATNEDLAENVKKGDFREDLYHRLNEFKIHVPPLRERGEDIDLFIKHFILLANKELGRHVEKLSPEAVVLFHKYDWPGNLRELKNVVRHTVLLSKSDEAGIENIPHEMAFAVENAHKKSISENLKAMNEANEKEMIIKVLEKVKYNKSKAAEMLNIDRKTLYNKITKYQIE